MLESPDMQPRHRASTKLILASNSPRRRELLSLTGLDYRLLPAAVDETPLPGEDGAVYVRRIADSKVMATVQQAGSGVVIIAADTAVVDRDGRDQVRIYGKPGSPAEAVAMLRSLRGHTHQVFTALSILPAGEAAPLVDLCATDVPMRNYSEDEIHAYVATGDPFDKAGAYAIQHAGFHPVDQLHGCFANVMGLPLCHLGRNLAPLGIQPANDIPQACQSALGYVCPVYQSILRFDDK